MRTHTHAIFGGRTSINHHLRANLIWKPWHQCLTQGKIILHQHLSGSGLHLQIACLLEVSDNPPPDMVHRAGWKHFSWKASLLPADICGKMGSENLHKFTKFYQRPWFHRDFGSKAKFTVRVSCKMSLSLVTAGAKLMYIYHTLDALVMITPFQSIALQRESDFSCTLVEFGKIFDQIWKIPIGTGSGMSSPPFRPPG